MTTTPIFPKTFDFVSWLLAETERFPRSQRFVVTRRLLDAALDFQELLVDANAQRGRARLSKLDLADAELDTGTIRTTGTTMWGFGVWLLTTFPMPEMPGDCATCGSRWFPGRGLKAGAVRSWPRLLLLSERPGE